MAPKKKQPAPKQKQKQKPKTASASSSSSAAAVAHFRRPTHHLAHVKVSLLITPSLIPPLQADPI